MFEHWENHMTETTHVIHEVIPVTRDDLITLLNEDLAGEFQAIIAGVIYSKMLKGPQHMSIAAELEKYAAEELAHALTIAGQIDRVGGVPQSVPKLVTTSTDAKELLQSDLNNRNETIARYRKRICQCEELGEYAMAEQIRGILVQEQNQQIALATALGIPVPNVTGLRQALPVNQSQLNRTIPDTGHYGPFVKADDSSDVHIERF